MILKNITISKIYSGIFLLISNLVLTLYPVSHIIMT
jgi:hypothetical protein